VIRIRILLLILFGLCFSVPVYSLVNISDITSSEDAEEAIKVISKQIKKSPERQNYMSQEVIFISSSTSSKVQRKTTAKPSH